MGTTLSSETATVDLFWTSGWDSTFRLLQLLIVEKKVVQPHFVFFEKRISSAMELRCIEKITEKIKERFPEAATRLLPIIQCSSNDFPVDKATLEAYRRIIKTYFIGNQYVQLSDYCRLKGIKYLELSIHRDDKAHHLIEQYSRKVEINGLVETRLDETITPPDIARLFCDYLFPIFDLTKKEMESYSKEHQFDDIMDMTWFCHDPLPDGNPCGYCNPCVYTIREGMGHRIPYRDDTRYRIYRFAFRLLAPWRKVKRVLERLKKRIIG